jgi:hypothetical protein
MTPIIFLIVITLSVLLMFAVLTAVISGRMIWHLMAHMTADQLDKCLEYIHDMSLHEFLFRKKP